MFEEYSKNFSENIRRISGSQLIMQPRSEENMDSDFFYRCISPLGGITMTSDGYALTGLWFDGQKYAPVPADIKTGEKAMLPVFCETQKWLDQYFGGEIPDFTPPLLIRATPFRKEVLEILLTIPYGKTMSYGEIAAILTEKHPTSHSKHSKEHSGRMSAQAVGGAVGHNPISIIIPCHRVIGSDGSMTGYAGGIERKVRLLQIESGVRQGIHPPGLP